MILIEKYKQDLIDRDFVNDSMQEFAIVQLQKLYDQLVTDGSSSLFAKLNIFAFTSKKNIQGLYFWGGVGRGKTYLMDMFYNNLPFTNKLRMHFHIFMRYVHSQLIILQGVKNPLREVAKQLAKKTRIICFDEFFVSDIADAMILSELLKQLFSYKITLVATSNVEPSLLYKDGLQRARFLPAIDLINTHTKVFNIDGGIDYRLTALDQASTYYFPLNDETYEQLSNTFNLLQQSDQLLINKSIMINNRSISCKKQSGYLAWFTFSSLCEEPRSQNDYIELAYLFHTIFLEGVLQMGASEDNMARRFVNLIDVLYDSNVNVILSAKVDLENLYVGGNLSFEFKRTRSRLQEMQTKAYLAKPHKL